MNNLQRLQKLAGIPITESVKVSEPLTEASNAFNVFLNGKKIDTVFDTSDDAADVKKSLVNHDGMDPEIVVKKEKYKKKVKKEVKEGAEEFSDESLFEEPDLWVLKVKEPDSEKFGIQFSGTKSECVEEWRDTKKDWPKGSKHSIEKHVDEKKEIKNDKDVKEDVDLTPEEIANAILSEEDGTKTPEVDYQNGPKENSGIIRDQKNIKALKIPTMVKAAVTKRIKELKDAIKNYDTKGYDEKSIKSDAVDCLEKILHDASKGDLEGVKQAQIYMTTLMSPLMDFFPPQLVNWLANVNNPLVKEATDEHKKDHEEHTEELKRYMKELLDKEKETGKDSDECKAIQKKIDDYKSKE